MGCFQHVAQGVRTLLASVLTVVALDTAAHPLTLVVNYTDGPSEGFNDPVVGADRRVAFELAVNHWAGTLAGAVPVVIDAAMDPLGGGGVNAILARTGATTLHQGFRGAPDDAVYGAALANDLGGRDLNGPELSEMQVTFNSDVDGPLVLGSIGFYYGTDQQAGFDVDFVSVALHEIGHGLNFFDIIDPGSGRWLFFDTPGIFEQQIIRPGVGSLARMRDAERLVAITSNDIVWAGAHVVAAHQDPAPLYAPDRYEQGSSVSHWDISFSPNQLIEPFYVEPIHDLGLLLPALVDMGWGLAGATFTPPPATNTPTPTPTLPPQPTGTPTRPVRLARLLAYVTNFDSDDVSVIDVAMQRVIATVPVHPGPIGVAAMPDGKRAYVAGFHAGTLSVIRTSAHRVEESVPVGASADNVAITPSGELVYVTDPTEDRVVAVETQTNSIVASIPVGPQPAGIAVTANGRRVFVTEFGASSVAVIDTRLNRMTARIVLNPDAGGALGIALDGPTRGYATTFFSGTFHVFHTTALARLEEVFLNSPSPRFAEAIALSPSGEVAYVATHSRETGAGEILFIDTAENDVERSIAVGDSPEALAVSPDGAFLYVANAGSDTVSVIDTRGLRVVATIPVGLTPMGVAFARAPICPGDCDGSGQVTLSELVTAVRMALDEPVPTGCESVDDDGSGAVTIDEVIRATGNALNDCAE